MNKMTMWFSTIFVTMCILHVDGSTVAKEKDTCEAIFVDVDQNRGSSLIIFKFISPHTAEGGMGSTAFYSTYSTTAISTHTNDSSTTTTISESIQKTTDLTNSTQQTRQSGMNNVTKHKGQKEIIPTCVCQFESSTKSSTNTLTFSIKPRNKTAHLNVNGSELDFGSQNLTFKNINVRLLWKTNNLMNYTLILEVAGNLSNVTCSGSQNTSSAETNGARREVLFQITLLILGAVMVVFGFILIISGTAVWRRYRVVRRKQAKAAVNLDMEEYPQDNYEVMSNDGDRYTKTLLRTEQTCRRSSAMSASELKHKQNSASSSRHQSLEGSVTLSADAGRMTPSPNTPHHKLNIFASPKKKKKQNVDKEKNNKDKNIEEDDEETYSCEMQDYEELSEDLPRSPIKRDVRVATPFLLALNSEIKLKSLRPTENLIVSQGNGRPLPKTEPPENIVYSHLKRAGRSLSYISKNSADYDEVSLGEDTAHCQTTGGVCNSNNMFTFPKLISHKPKGVDAVTNEEKEETNSNTNDNQGEQDHIYEAFEKEDAKEVGQENASRNKKCVTEQPESEKVEDQLINITNTEDDAKQHNITEDITSASDVANSEQDVGQQNSAEAILPGSSDNADQHGNSSENEETKNADINKDDDEHDDDSGHSDAEDAPDPEHETDVRLSSIVRDISPATNQTSQNRQSGIIDSDNPHKDNDIRPDIIIIAKPKLNPACDSQNKASVYTEISLDEPTDYPEVIDLTSGPTEASRIILQNNEIDSERQDKEADDYPEGCVIFDNILYESLTLSQPSSQTEVLL